MTLSERERREIEKREKVTSIQRVKQEDLESRDQFEDKNVPFFTISFGFFLGSGGGGTGGKRKETALFDAENPTPGHL